MVFVSNVGSSRLVQIGLARAKSPLPPLLKTY